MISRALVSGAEKAGNLINTNTPKLINKITPASQAAYINPKVAKGLKMTGTATSGAAQVTGFVGMFTLFLILTPTCFIVNTFNSLIN